jgi:hypothetical protein
MDALLAGEELSGGITVLLNIAKDEVGEGGLPQQIPLQGQFLRAPAVVRIEEGNVAPLGSAQADVAGGGGAWAAFVVQNPDAGVTAGDGQRGIG